jgi:hypothetical protein
VSPASPASEDRWTEVHGHFVDDPQGAMLEAAALVRAQLETASQRLDALERRLRTLPPGPETTEELRRAVQNLRRIADGLVRF